MIKWFQQVPRYQEVARLKHADQACRLYVSGVCGTACAEEPYHLHVPIVLKSGSLSLLEPSRPVQACNGIPLPLPLPLCAEEHSETFTPRGYVSRNSD